MQIKFALAGLGILLLIWGMRVDDERIRWVAMALLAVSILMRFLPKRLREGDYPRKGNGADGSNG